MHASMIKVFAIAKDAGIDSKEQVAEKLNASSSSMDKWIKRGISIKGAMAASRVFGVESGYILDGGLWLGANSEVVVASNQKMQVQQTLQTIPPNKMLLLKTVSTGGLLSVEADDIVSIENKPPTLSSNSFMLLVLGRNMMPILEVNDYAVVEADITTCQLKDGDIVVVQHKDKNCGVFKQVIFGETKDDIYLTHTNKEIPNWQLTPLTEFTLIGMVVSKFKFYK